MDGSDFRAPPPMSLPFSLVHGCPPPVDRDADLLGYRVFSMSGSTWPRTPGSTDTARRGAIPIAACRRVKPVGALQLNFSGLNTFKVGSTRYLYTSPAFVPTHRRARVDAPVAGRASRLDTGLAAHDDPSGICTPLDYATLPSRTDLFYPA